MVQCSHLLLAAALVGGLGACGDDDTTGHETTPDPDPTPEPKHAEELLARGPYAVGFRQTSLTYTPPAATEPRTLPISIWYPATDGGEGPAEYSVAGIVDVPTSSVLAGPALADPHSGRGPFPLAVYSHGSGGDSLLAYPYAELFASHGWVTISANHIGNTVLDDVGMTSDSFGRIALNRPNDVTAVIDWAVAPPNDPLAGKVDTSRVFLFGHSFGAYTALTAGGVDVDAAAVQQQICEGQCTELDDPIVQAAYASGFGDPRIVAISPEAPALVPQFIPGQLAALTPPTLLMSSVRDQTTPHEEQGLPAWAGLDGPEDLRLDLINGGHYSFITICDDLSPALLEAFRPNAANDGCGADFTPVAEIVPVLAAYTLGFARWHVLGEDGWAEVLRGPALHAELVVTTR
jgi:predicted dienelactone hydrolase